MEKELDTAELSNAYRVDTISALKVMSNMDNSRSIIHVGKRFRRDCKYGIEILR
jgi:hypothetical protein